MKVVLRKDRFYQHRSSRPEFLPASMSLIPERSERRKTPALIFRDHRNLSRRIRIDENEIFQAAVRIEEHVVDFSIVGIHDADELSVEFTDTNDFTVRVVHKGAAPPNCRARCPDGTEGHPCVTCKDGNKTFKVCC